MAARGNTIVIASNPQGKFLSGVVSGTPKPGTAMEIQTPFYRGNQHLWRAYQPGTDGDRRVVAVLIEDEEQGIGIDTAFVDGTQCRLYCPIPGEELNMLYKNVAGTADDVLALDMMILDSGTGKLIVTTGTPESEPFQALAAVTDPTEDVLIPCLYTGQ